jgi:hypothetical protein
MLDKNALISELPEKLDNLIRKQALGYLDGHNINITLIPHIKFNIDVLVLKITKYTNLCYCLIESSIFSFSYKSLVTCA